MDLTTTWRRTTPVLLTGMLCLLATACGGGGNSRAAEEPDPPVGKPVLPDLMPKPQLNVLTKKVNGKWLIYFNTTLVNVGAGDFVLRATREPGGSWKAEQDVQYSTSGAKRVSVVAPLAWGGDGHEHWHIVRVASVWLVPLDAKGRPVGNSKDRIDSKIGFCFYDHTHELDRGPVDAQYSAHSCGDESDTVIGMGLSVGWNDKYLQTLPGQNIDVSGLPDGRYRLYTEVDEKDRLREATRDNNLTWIDVELRMTPQGLAAPTIATGPIPS